MCKTSVSVLFISMQNPILCPLEKQFNICNLTQQGVKRYKRIYSMTDKTLFSFVVIDNIKAIYFFHSCHHRFSLKVFNWTQ